MKGRVLLVALALSFLGLTGMAEGAIIHYVSDQAQFQFALNDAQGNGMDDIINVTADMTITATLTYSTPDGDGGSKLTINGNGHYLDGGNSVQIMSINTDSDNTNNGDDAGGDVVIDNLTFQNGNNSGGDGGGLFIDTYAANVTLTNNTFSGNIASSLGGGARVYTDSGTATLTNNTFSGNTAGNYGGGAYVWLNEDTATANIYNNIIYGNTSSAGNDLYVNSDGNINGSTVNLHNNDLGVNSDFVTAQSEDLYITNTDNYKPW